MRHPPPCARPPEMVDRWVVQNARGESERSEARHHLVLEIAPQRGSAFRLLAGAGDGDPAPQIDEKFAAVEIGVRAGDGGGAAHIVALCGCMLELVAVDNYRPLDIACGPTPRQGRAGERTCSRSCIWMSARSARCRKDGASRSS